MRFLLPTLLLTLLFITCKGYAQRANFIRVYDLDGEKLYKGYITEADENFLHLKRGGMNYSVPYNAIGHIKGYRSFGHYAGGGAGYAALAGVGAGLVIFSQSMNDTSGIGGAVGAGMAAVTPVVFALAGYIGGLVIYATKKKISYDVNGNKTQWDYFRNVYYGTTEDATTVENEINNGLLSPDTNGI
ncbi:hypothetical protein E7Z59_04570 [Robertkochia marina]|uniref:Uncharacterized protein n=1 Tax=Robertkochia marina TaxID=1227945 RepID=A0A4S3M3D7_9FLAO|nr:hypothetical protein [Robertkochia marina]THD69606.1 hypothetical protein E7Z59_04570 [Robertkochia marina]TRZ40836.1 hypothetical protein D3A96_15130 [Robertkochia marina]